ncbi:HAD-IC family P-type ATPase, partial [Patescibacteria group bacterium]|nr:HAD-IC family P-type ATPase [Patescibacteria group bacterium]
MSSIEYGLTTSEVQASGQKYGRNELDLHKTSLWGVFWRQVNNPLLIILAVTTLVSYYFDDHVNAGIIFLIMSVSVGLGFINEYSSEKTVGDLLRKVSLSAIVVRNGLKLDVPVRQIVVGDIVILQQGSVVPADLHLVEVSGLLVDESSLTGESLPVQKKAQSKDEKTSWAFMGTVVTAGSGKGVVQAIGRKTEFGRLSGTATGMREKTAFQKGLANLSTLMTRVILVMAVGICLLNIGLGKPPLEALLFALAIAIGLTPALLPVIVTVSMA